MSKYYYGIDIGGTSIKMGLFNNEKSLIEKWEIPTNIGENGKNIINDIVASVKKHTPNFGEVIGYGFGVPGPVTDNYIPVFVNLEWKDINIKNDFKDLLQNENIVSGNDANVAALGEAAYGAGKGYSDVVMITLGTGVGSGFIVNNEIVEGAHGCAGELGHLTVEHNNGLSCNCGKKGCLETIASATGIKNIYYRMKEEYEGVSSLYELDHPSAKAVFDAARKGDELALKVVDYAAYYLGYTCHVIGITTNPAMIVIGGGVSKAGEFLINKVKENFLRFCFTPTKATQIHEAKLGNDAGIYGALQLVINNG